MEKTSHHFEIENATLSEESASSKGIAATKTEKGAEELFIIAGVPTKPVIKVDIPLTWGEKEMDRRRFLKTAGVAAATIVAAPNLLNGARDAIAQYREPRKERVGYSIIQQAGVKLSEKELAMIQRETTAQLPAIANRVYQETGIMSATITQVVTKVELSASPMSGAERISVEKLGNETVSDALKFWAHPRLKMPKVKFATLTNQEELNNTLPGFDKDQTIPIFLVKKIVTKYSTNLVFNDSFGAEFASASLNLEKQPYAGSSFRQLQGHKIGANLYRLVIERQPVVWNVGIRNVDGLEGTFLETPAIEVLHNQFSVYTDQQFLQRIGAKELTKEELQNRYPQMIQAYVELGGIEEAVVHGIGNAWFESYCKKKGINVQAKDPSAEHQGADQVYKCITQGGGSLVPKRIQEIIELYSKDAGAVKQKYIDKKQQSRK